MIYYSIIVDNELQTTCSSYEIAQHICDIYIESNTFPGKIIQIVKDPFPKKAEKDPLSEFLNKSFSYA